MDKQVSLSAINDGLAEARRKKKEFLYQKNAILTSAKTDRIIEYPVRIGESDTG